MLRSRIYNGRSILCLDLAAPESEDIGNLEKAVCPAACAAGNTARMTDLSLLTAIDGADHPFLSPDQARGVRFVASCEPARTLAEESIAGRPAGSVPPICEPCGVWVSLDASQDS
jgi:hypothetical protein